MDEGFKEIISNVSPSARELALAARRLIYKVYPKAVEVAWPKQKVVGYGIGRKKMSEHIAYLSISKQHINIGFYYGAQLTDLKNCLKEKVNF